MSSVKMGVSINLTQIDYVTGGAPATLHTVHLACSSNSNTRGWTGGEAY
jgi:hypothetical protein